MRHAAITRRFSERQRRTLIAVAEAVLPAGRIFPGAGEDTIDKIEPSLDQMPELLGTGISALVAGLDADALLHHGRTFANLTLPQRLALLDRWRRGGLARRTAIRGLITPIKVAHFDDPAFYRTLGCAYQQPKVAREAKPAWFRDRVHAGPELDGDLALECDVVVVGSGAGGAVVAKELAEAGVAVVLLEEGRYFDRADFTGRAFEMQRLMYRAGGTTFSIGNVPIPIPVGQTVGGSTTINSGTCYRVPGRVLRHWRDDLGLTELTEDKLGPAFDRVENILGVAAGRAQFLGGNARVIARGCDALGYKHQPLRRNAPDCDGKGICIFGCPTDAKRSTNVSYVPMALKAGVELFHGVRVERIVVSGGRATGVVARARGKDGVRRKLTVHARAVVIACGTLQSPVLLEANGLGGASGELGGNLSIHPAVGVLAEYDEAITGWDGIPQGYAIEEFHDEGILFEGVTLPLEYTTSMMPQIGPRLVELAERFQHVASFGFMVEDTSRGRVRTIGGRTVITYNVNDQDVARLKRGLDILARVFFAGGAKAVIPPLHGFDEIRGEDDLARLRRTDLKASDFELSAYHPLGTCRMGRDPAHSVVGPDHQLHDCAGLYVVDGSAVPSSLGVNPQVTIMALATRAAGLIAASLSRAG